MKEFLAWLGIFFGDFFSSCDSALPESFGSLRWPTWPRRRSWFVFLVPGVNLAAEGRISYELERIRNENYGRIWPQNGAAAGKGDNRHGRLEEN